MGTKNKEQRAKTLYYRLALRRQDIFVFCLLSFVFVLNSCKTQTAVAPIILHDSVSITYKQGREQPTPSQILCNPQRVSGDSNEQPSPSGLRGAQTAFRRNSSVPADGTVGLGATREASVSEEALSERTKKRLFLPPTIIRVDTVFVERWHTTEVPSPPKPIPRLYKDCTWGFFILLLLILGRIAFRIIKATYLHVKSLFFAFIPIIALFIVQFCKKMHIYLCNSIIFCIFAADL